MKKFFALPALLIALIICANFLNCKNYVHVSAIPNDYVYFTIHVDDVKYEVTEDLLRGGWWNEGAKSIIRKGASLYETEKLDDVWALVEKIIRTHEIKPFDGIVKFSPHQDPKFSVYGSKSGRDIDEDRLRANILTAIKNRQYVDIHAHPKLVLPKSEYEITSRLGLRGGYQTRFESNPNREHNIALALSKFNGMVIGNGQSVSFNSVVGRRTIANGFREAKIILDGEFVPGVGGGVCQASTTLFNAVLSAGLTIDKSQSHSLPISYVPLGRDAMISSSADLRFTNNTGGTVYIETGTTDATENRKGTAWVKIYGDKTNIKYRPRTVTHEIPPKADEITSGWKTTTYLDAIRDGKIVNTKTIRTSRYNGVKAKPSVAQ